ncbi:MAG: PAS domain S-box protein [Nitrospinae bacterium]|nr:PAS domain S-box protein [Nitrospinota bacterium]
MIRNVASLARLFTGKPEKGKKASLIVPRRQSILTYLLISIVLFASVPAIAVEKTVLPDPVTLGKPISPRFYLMEDNKRNIGIDDAGDERYDGHFILSQSDSLALGLSSSAFWVRFTVVNSSAQTASWILENDHPLWDFVEFYTRDESGRWITKRSGDHIPFAEREIAYRKSTFHVTLPPGAERTYYLRFYGEIMQSAKIKMTLWPADAFNNRNTTEYILLGLYFGAMAVMFFYNLFLYYSIGDRNYLWYVLYVLGISLSMFAYNGLAFQYLWPASPYLADFASLLFGYIAYVFIAFFGRSFLETYRDSLLLDTLFILAAIISMAGIAFCLLGWMVMAMRLIYLMVMAVSVFYIIAGLVRLLDGYRPARFYLISWSAVAAGMLTMALKDMGFIPYTELTLWAPQIGTWLDVVLLSFALADRINCITAERENAMAEAEHLSERLQSVMDNTLAVIYIKDKSGRYITVNKRYEKLFAIAKDRIAGKSDYELFPRDAAETFRRNDESALRTGEPLEVEEAVPQADGIHTYISIKFPLRDRKGEIYAVCGISTDITERKRAEEELSRFVNLIPDMVCIASTDGYFIKINPMWEKTLGYTQEELLATPFLLFVHPDDRDATMREVERQISGKPTIEFVNRYLCKDGGYKWLEWMATPSPDGRLLFAAARDITERKQAQEALRKSEERHRTILQTAMGGVWVVGSQGRLLEVNESYCRMSGYSAQELMVMRIPDLEAVESPDATTEHIQMIMEKGEDRFESRHRRKDGSVFDVEVSVQYRPADGGLLVGFIQDITERKRAEAEIVSTRNQLQATLEAIPDLLFEVGLDGRYHDYHASRSELLADPSGLFMGKLVSETLPPSAADTVLSALQEAHENGQSFGKQFELELPQGKLCFELSVARKTTAHGQEPRFIALSRDITKRKRAEEALIASYDHLETQVRERTAELEKARRQAEEATRLKGQFILLVSHDIRSPLSSIIMVLKSMLDDMADPLTAHHRRLTDKAYDVAVRLVEMIQKVLNISRIQTGALKIRPGSFEAASFLNYSLVPVLPKATEKGISIKTEASGGLKIRVDADVFAQVIQNLAGNAIKFTHPGGVVTISAAESGAWSRITVRDSGVGISEKGFANLFKQGVEYSGLGTAGEKGAGLGLLLCKEIVEAHGGRIEVESRLGEGSAFHVFLPAGKFTALLVDDQPAALEIAKGYLRKMGMGVVEAGNGQEAMKRIEEMIPDIVITDISMPVMDGLELLENIRSGEGTKSIPVIVATSNRDPDSQRRAHELGADGFVLKPISENDLLPMVKKLLERAKPL